MLRNTLSKKLLVFILSSYNFFQIFKYILYSNQSFQPAATDPPHLSHIQFFGHLIKVDGKIKYEVLALINFCLFEKAKKF